jgi:hypothetical protein
MREVVPRRANGYPVSRDLTARLVPVAGLRHLGRETRKHSPAQIKKVAGISKSLGSYCRL